MDGNGGVNGPDNDILFSLAQGSKWCGQIDFVRFTLAAPRPTSGSRKGDDGRILAVKMGRGTFDPLQGWGEGWLREWGMMFAV